MNKITVIPKPWKNESELTFDDLTDCIDGLIEIFNRNDKINCDAFDRVFKAKICLKEIRKIVVKCKPEVEERISRCECATFDADGCWCSRYNCLVTCIGDKNKCMKDYIN